MPDITPNHPAVEAAARAMHAAYERRAERWEAFYTRTPWEAIGEDSQAEFIGYVHQPLNAALPHLTADDLPTRLVRGIQARTIRAWSWTHKWSSLVSTVFLLMLCVTGLPLVFTHEIEHALMREAWQPARPNGPRLNLDQVLDAALARKPGEVPAFMSFDEDRPVVNVTSVRPGGKAGVYSFQPIDHSRKPRSASSVTLWASQPPAARRAVS